MSMPKKQTKKHFVGKKNVMTNFLSDREDVNILFFFFLNENGWAKMLEWYHYKIVGKVEKQHFVEFFLLLFFRPELSCMPQNEPAFLAKLPEEHKLRGQAGPRSEESIQAAQEQIAGIIGELKKHNVEVSKKVKTFKNRNS